MKVKMYKGQIVQILVCTNNRLHIGQSINHIKRKSENIYV